MPALLRFCTILFCLFVLTCPARAERNWVEVQSPHFLVVSDASEKAARQVASEFEQMRYVFSARFGDAMVGSGAPLTIMAARDEDTYRELDPALWKRSGATIAGVYYTGWESQYALVRLDDWQGQAQTTVYHEYTHSILHANTHWLPIWLDEGLAEFYAYTQFRDHKIYIGAPTLRYRTLISRPLLPIDTMLEVNGRSPMYRGNNDTDMFYAEAWAMVHYMSFGPDMDGGHKLNTFVNLLQNGTDQKTAFAQTFGDTKAFEQGLQRYLSRFSFQAGVIPQPPNLDPGAFTSRKLTPAEADYRQACFHLHSGDPIGGRALLSKALALDPNLAVAHEETGFADFQDGKDDEARQQWATALKLDPNLYRSLFAETMSQATPLSAQTPAQLAETKTSLERVTQRNTSFAPAWVELALVAWRDGRMQEAYNDAQHAESLAPWRAGYHLLTGDILLHGGRPDMAAQYARYVAKLWVGPDHDEAVDLWQQVPAAKRGDGPPLSFDMPSSFKIVRGTLLTDSCDEKARTMTMTLRPDGTPDAQPLTFTSNGALMIGFSDTLWWGEDHFSSCHNLAEHPALVGYLPKGSDGGTVVDLEVRDALPSAPASAAAQSAASSTLSPPAPKP